RGARSRRDRGRSPRSTCSWALSQGIELSQEVLGALVAGMFGRGEGAAHPLGEAARALLAPEGEGLDHVESEVAAERVELPFRLLHQADGRRIEFRLGFQPFEERSRASEGDPRGVEVPLVHGAAGPARPPLQDEFPRALDTGLAGAGRARLLLDAE